MIRHLYSLSSINLYTVLGRTQSYLKLLIFVSFVTVLNCYPALSQSGSRNISFEKANFESDKEGFKEALKELQRGEASYKNSVYSEALAHFELAQKFNPNNAELNMKIGHCYLYSSHKPQALGYLEKATALDAPLNNFIHFLLGHGYQLNMKWDEAIKSYGVYVSNASDENKGQIEIANKKIEECKYGKELVESPVKVKITNLGSQINSEFADYHPLISADEAVMYFTARRDSTTGGNRDPNFDVYYEDIYKSKKKEDSTWSTARGIGEPINTEFHDATVGLAPDGQKLFVYKDDEGDGNIYECILNGDVWSEPIKLNKNINSEYTEPTACFSYDGRTIYFISDRPGGFGENDIYISKLGSNGEWDVASNLGATINSEYNEEAVFMHPDGKTLYFSSQGHKTMGGYDLFKSIYNKKSSTWSSPENLGYPINTPDDDVFFVMGANGERGYYSSIKADGMGEKDIYMITFLETESSPELTLVKGKIIDKNTGLPIEAYIEVIDNDKNEIVANSKSNKLTGEFLFSLPSGRDYGVTVTADGYFFHSENIDIPESSPFYELFKNIHMNSMDVGKSMVLNFIFFDFDKAALKSQSIIELERVVTFMGKNKSLKIEISGHTDNKGTVGYNQKLSNNRAKSVVTWLIKNGIAADRMVSEGYGFSQPKATNDTEEGRAKNRRTEFKILEFNKSRQTVVNAAPTSNMETSNTNTPTENSSPKEMELIIEESGSLQIDNATSKTEEVIAEMESFDSEEPSKVEEVEEVLPSSTEPKLVKTEDKMEVVEEVLANTTRDNLSEDQFSTSKMNYYATNKIPIDPELPPGIIYKVQIGSYSKLPGAKVLKGLYPVMANKLPSNIYRCSVGVFKTYDAAKNAQVQVRSAGFSDAFLIAFYNGKKISVSQAVNIN
ncbi:MAG: hypothetical protein COB85_01505 [Bacteroidetes bacterium]|nr:MAG: hypothetical protein COB85_01505 [Bacteroidota bacterium]